MAGDVVDDIPDTFFKSRSDNITEARAAISGNFAKIGKSAIGLLNLHARRKVANAFSTSCSFAMPLLSASSSA